MKLFRSRTYHHHLTLFFVGCAATVVVLFVLLITVMWGTSRIYVERANQSSNDHVRTMTRRIYGELDELMREFSVDLDLLQAVTQGNSRPAGIKLEKAVQQQPIPCYYFLTDLNGQMIHSNLLEENLDYCKSSPSFNRSMEQLQKSPSSVICAADDVLFGGGQSTICHFAVAVRQQNRAAGFLFFCIGESAVEKMLWQEPVDGVVVVDAQNRVIASTLHGVARDMQWRPDVFASRHVTEGILELNSKPFYVTRSAAGFGLEVYTFSNISTRAVSTYAAITATGALTLLALLVIFFTAKKTIYKNQQAMQNLLTAVSECQKGNIAYRIRTDTFTEFQQLYDAFNEMMNQMQGLIEKNLELADRRRVMEIAHLEGQFNPHFLFNLLENLKYVILMDPKEASRMVVGLSKLMRYSINYGRVEVELSTDLEYIETYLMLQKSRYGSRLECSVEVEPELLNCKVPKLLLQPLIENSIVHNAEKTEHMYVQLRGFRLEDKICFTIVDNGQGVGPGRLFELQQMLQHNNAAAEHIGLYNVHRTIQLMYGEEYGITLQSVYNHGMKIQVVIPYRGGDKDV